MSHSTRLGLFTAASLLALIVTAISAEQARAGEIRLDPLQIPAVISGSNGTVELEAIGRPSPRARARANRANESITQQPFDSLVEGCPRQPGHPGRLALRQTGRKAPEQTQDLAWRFKSSESGHGFEHVAL